MKRIFVVQEKCQGCRSCEIACAVEHSQSKDLFLAIQESPLPKSRVIVTVIRGQPDLIRCQHCKRALCIEACEQQAIYRDESGLVLIDQDKCIGCWKCVEKCPFKAIFKDEEKGVVYKCDYCRGIEQPRCVSACPTKAIYFCEPEEFKTLLKTLRA